MPPESPDLELGCYRLESRLGAGGMGTVYRALDTRLNRPVAIKFLSDEAADAAARRRFQREAQTASSLNHPHILTVHDVGDFEGRQYIVTEFVDGGTLADWARAEKRTWKAIVELLTGVADGLATAHAAGILHRDIKPANILVARNGYAKLADFGLAKLDERPAAGEAAPTVTGDATRPGVIVGTVAYMSPEQASGVAVDARSDIFSFGVVLYELLSGRRPFSGRTDLETLHKVVQEVPEPLPADIPARLRDLVEKALEKDPAERYQSMRDLVVDLKRSGRSVSLPPASAAARPTDAWKWILAGVAVLALLVAGAVEWMSWETAAAPENLLANAEFTRLTDFEGSEMDAAISRDGRFVAFRSDRDGPIDTWVTQVGRGDFVNLTRGTRSQVLVRNTGFSYDGSEVWLSSARGGDRLRLVPLMGGVARPFLFEHSMEPAWSPDGSQIVSHPYDDGDPFVITDRDGGNPRQILTLRAGAHSHYPIWSPDGQWIYFVSGSWDAREMDIWRIRPSGGSPERLTTLNTDIRYLAFLDTHTVLYTSPDQNGAGPWLWALDTNTRRSVRVGSGLEVYSSVDASADGRRLVVTVSRPSANLSSMPILDRPAEERDVKPYPLPSVRAYAPRFGGTALFYLSSRGGGDGLWREQNGQAIEVWRGADGALLEPAAVSPDGQRVAVILRKQGTRRLTMLSAEGGDARALAPSLDVTSSASWAPDGQWIVAAGVGATGPGLYKIPAGGGDPVKILSGDASNPVWAPDGSVIAYTGPVSGPVGPLLMIHPDGSPLASPPIRVRVNTEHYRFVPGRRQLVYVPTPTQIEPELFWMLDLDTMTSRRLSNVDLRPANRTFDVTPDGTQIVFDRLKDNSDIVLIDLPARR
jgi:Tol biopolymer transport system component/predicted Ser/Thr protein kinase